MAAVSSSPRRWWALVAIVLSVLTVGFDTTILNVALPTLATELDAGNAELQWLVDAYVLVFAGLLLPMGALGDRYGRKRLLMIGLLLFAAASLGAVFAGSVGQVIAARAVMGVGGAILTPITLAILPVLFAPHERGKAIAVLTMGMGIGLPLGPIIGGYLLEHFWWGSIFVINIPVAVIAAVAVGLLVPESKAATPKPVDFFGAILSTIGLTALVYGVIEAPARGWTDGLVLGALAGGLVLLAVFAVVERRIAAPMIDLRLFRRPRFAWGTTAGTIASFALFGVLFILPLFLQAVLGHDALGVGLRLLPLIGGMFVGAPLGARIAGRVPTRVPVAAGLLVGAAGMLLGATTGTGSGYGFVATWLLVTGAGVGLALTPAMDAVMGELPRDEAGSGTAVTMTLRQVGGALGVALLGSLTAGVYRDRLGPAPEVAHDSVTAAMAVAARTGDQALALAARGAFLDAMSAVLFVCAGVVLAGAVLVAVFLPGARPPEGAEESVDELTRVA
ncbi:DHA2 family efflux MFS transporter permease subunit [Dactylosporangium fulvum]|uniref:MFS transporter n=1 Tax=Dactylosporangium fulvum TaxID=53359 RepID=A0ABY5VX54_9ACTN|nr:MFS transporter [Dactylosporangium fulvum]UWP82292.1 MFS transporter [Dactylosporangium fulvum]